MDPNQNPPATTGGGLSPEQFEVLRADYQAALKEHFKDLLRDQERVMAMLASPWRTRLSAAGHLGCSERTIDGYLATGELPRKFMGSTVMVRVEDLDKLPTAKKSTEPLREREKRLKPQSMQVAA